MTFSANWQDVRAEIRRGIEAELEKSSEYIEFVVERKEAEGRVWKVFIDSSQSLHAGLDETLEGSNASWAGPPRGAADVLSVNPETEQINLRYATSDPPDPNEKIRIYPPRYLEALLQCWSHNEWAQHCLNWLDDAISNNSNNPTLNPKPGSFQSWLRTSQSEAFQLPSYHSGFLWGPPGTGKTTTVGAVLAQYLIQFPSSRVCLLSTTNVAVDLALVSVDKCLEQLAQTLPAAKEVRKRCFRIGNHFIAGNYQGREHLLPVKDETLVQQLAQLESERPDPEKVAAYARWKEQVEMVRQKIREQAVGVLKNARLSALTTTRVAFTFDDLFELHPYDFVVFDEASQVPLAHALIAAPLGKRTLFAGDPKQLAPIVQAEDKEAKLWLGSSMFYHMNESSRSTVFLNEQSRMAEPICRIVSNVFYKGKLDVDRKSIHDKKWKLDREPVSVPYVGKANACVYKIDHEGTWSAKYHGPIRFESARFVADLICELKAYQDEEDILVLTPFRAQRTMIRTSLRYAHCSHVTVSTVHRAQGSEKHTVIFDPVKGDSPFLNTEEAKRLINVAISRTMARFVIILSPGDRVNPILRQIAALIENSSTAEKAIPIANLVGKIDFPKCALQKVVRIKDVVGRVTEILNDGEHFQLMDFQTGHIRTFQTSLVRKSFG